jgi:outer membrane receptor protein involved in Fe transport
MMSSGPYQKALRRGAFGATLLASTMLAGVPAAVAQDAAVEELVVTAQKRAENIQDVPIAMTAFSTKKLEELQVNDFTDYAKFLPSVAYQSTAPGYSNVYMRGVASGGDGNHSGSLPSVGTYLDEAPITTIGGALDVHIYDVARVEALAGPQGTLYGASSQAGTLRIITNQPELGEFSGRYDLSATAIDHGAPGYVAEGVVNIPVSENAAVRLVAFAEEVGGYIDNVPGTRTYPTSGVTIDNDGLADEDYNTKKTYGGRAALRIDLNDSWTVKPTVMAQDTKYKGIFGYDPTVGDLQVMHFKPEGGHDRWYQAALAVEGKVANFDLVYAGAYMERKINTESDYTDYSFFYDTLFGSGAYITDDLGVPVDPTQYILGKDKFTKETHEVRLSSPQDKRVRVVGGLFYQKHTHDILQNYRIDAIGSSIAVTGWPGTLWLTDQYREDKDTAAFGEVAFDATDKLTITGGVRAFKAQNSLKGFFGFSGGYSSRTGEAACFGPTIVGSGPCTNLDAAVKETGETYKLNVTYDFDDDRMVYATYSTGFRPGGVNRRASLPPYKSDFIKNYELGWKTLWADKTLRFNGAVYYETWDDFQFSILGANSFTEIRNAGQARIYGVETDVTWQPVQGLTLNAAAAYTDAQLTENYCGFLDAQGNAVTNCASPEAPKGTALPVTPKLKANATARYEFVLGEYDTHLQGALVYQSSSWADLRQSERSILGKQDSFVSADVTAGVERDAWSLEFSIVNAFDERGDIYRYAQCTPGVCGDKTYIVPTKPRTFALRYGRRF